jgi:hypothetical protein
MIVRSDSTQTNSTKRNIVRLTCLMTGWDSMVTPTNFFLRRPRRLLNAAMSVPIKALPYLDNDWKDRN